MGILIFMTSIFIWYEIISMYGEFRSQRLMQNGLNEVIQYGHAHLIGIILDFVPHQFCTSFVQAVVIVFHINITIHHNEMMWFLTLPFELCCRQYMCISN